MPKYIDADAFLKLCKKITENEYNKETNAGTWSDVYLDVIDLVERTPGADVQEVRHSIDQLCNSEPLYWETWAGDLLKCPACKHEYTDAVECTNFCGNCGTPLQFKKDGN